MDPMKDFSFWTNWLVAAAALLIAFGLALAFFNQGRLFDALFNDRINPTFWRPGELDPGGVRYQRWVYGVLGATVAGWGTVAAFVAHYPFRRREGWARNAIALSTAVWYAADTAISLWFGVGVNATLNTAVLVLVWVPLVLTWKQFGRG